MSWGYETFVTGLAKKDLGLGPTKAQRCSSPGDPTVDRLGGLCALPGLPTLSGTVAVLLASLTLRVPSPPPISPAIHRDFSQ